MRDYSYRPYSLPSPSNSGPSQGLHGKQPTKQGPPHHSVRDHPGPYPRGAKGGWDCPSPANLTSVPYSQQHQLPPPQRHTGPSGSPTTLVPQPRLTTAQPDWKTHSRSGKHNSSVSLWGQMFTPLSSPTSPVFRSNMPCLGFSLKG